MLDSEKDLLIQQLLEQRDQMYREMRLKDERIAELESKDVKPKTATELDKALAQKDNVISKKDRTIKDLENRVNKLEGELEWLRRKMWGKMSEKFIPFDPNQRLFEWEGLDLLPEEEEAAKASNKDIEILRIQQEKRRQEIQLKKQPKRQPLPSDLPHEYIDLYPEGYEGHEEEWTLFEETEDSEHLEYTPGSFKVIVSRRHKGIRKEDHQIEIAPILSMPIAKSYAIPSLLAELHLGKYADHLPFYRQIEQFKRLGITLAPSTINDWFFECADLMRPLYYRIKDLVMSSDYVQCDETTIPIVNEEKHKTVKGYLWDVRAVMSGLLFFHYDHGSRAQKVALSLFHNYKGALQTDGYGVYEAFENKNGILLLGCWVHARRYFERALQNDKERAELLLSDKSSDKLINHL